MRPNHTKKRGCELLETAILSEYYATLSRHVGIASRSLDVIVHWFRPVD